MLFRSICIDTLLFVTEEMENVFVLVENGSMWQYNEDRTAIRFYSAGQGFRVCLDFWEAPPRGQMVPNPGSPPWGRAQLGGCETPPESNCSSAERLLEANASPQKEAEMYASFHLHGCCRVWLTSARAYKQTNKLGPPLPFKEGPKKPLTSLEPGQDT